MEEINFEKIILSQLSPATTMNWNEFELVRIINQDTRSKYLALHLSNKNNENSIVLLEKSAFNISLSLNELLSDLELVDTNDIYHRFINPVKEVECKVIFPATQAHLKKYSEQNKRIIQETPQMYQEITRSHFKDLRDSGQTSWIDNIITDQSEMERRLIDKKCPQTGFIILPDYKWIDESNLAALYLLVIVRRSDLWSIRDLTSDHLSILKDIRKELKESIFSLSNSKYKYPNGSPVLYDHIRVFFHYPPTYPHLHIHVTLASAQTSCAVGQAVLLDEVIDNLETVSPNYYKLLRTMSMEFGEQHELYLKLTK